MPRIQAERLVRRQAAGPPVQNGLQARLGHVFHHHPGVALVVLADVVDVQQIGVFQVEALAYAAQFDVEVAADQFQRDFLAGVAGGVIDFAEAALAHAPADGEAGQRARAGGIEEPARRRRWRRRWMFVRFQGLHLLPYGPTPALYRRRRHLPSECVSSRHPYICQFAHSRSISSAQNAPSPARRCSPAWPCPRESRRGSRPRR